MRGRPASRVVADERVLKQLHKMSRSRTVEASYAIRAKIILQCVDSVPVKQIAKNLGLSRGTVINWKKRFMEFGIRGLSDHSRSGRPPVHGDDFRRAVLAKLEEDPPAGFGQWDGVLLSQELGFPKDAIWKFLREQGISLKRRRTWCISTDPEFAAKAADIVGLYLAKDDKALVICVDEKPNIQALQRRTGYAIASDGKLVRGLQSTYKRNGTLNLFAALEVSTGIIHGKVTDSSQKTKKGFLEFMDDLLRDLPYAEEYHVILDNHSIHKRHELWLEQNPNVFFHYTPTSASWMNMVEIWLGILKMKSLRGASFPSKEALAEHIMKFIPTYNKTARPFIWRKREVKNGQLSNKIKNFSN